MGREQKWLETAYRALFQQDYDKAISFFRKAAEENPNNPKHYFRLSVTYGRNNRIIEATDEIAKAVLLEPANKAYHLQFRSLLARRLFQLLAGWVEQDKEVSLIRYGIKLTKQLDDLTMLQAKISLLEELIQVKEEQNERDSDRGRGSFRKNGTGSLPHD